MSCTENRRRPTRGATASSGSPRHAARIRALAGMVAFACLGAAPGLASPEAGISSARAAAVSPDRVERVREAVEWLAADERDGRGVGTEGLAEAEAWLARQLAEIGLEPAGSDGWYHEFDVPLEVTVEEGTSLTLAGHALGDDDWRPAPFSASGSLDAEVVAVGYGISAGDLSHDDYAEVDVKGKIVAVRRFVPPGARFAREETRRRFSDLRYKAFNAREHGAVGVLVVDWPELAAGEEVPDEAPLPDLRVDAKGDAGLPVAVLRRQVGKALFEGEPRSATLDVRLRLESTTARNVVGRIPAGSAGAGAGGAILLGAHFDHLGFGGRGSFEPDSGLVHNGADDNASGTAALLEVARDLMTRRQELKRDVWIAAFSAEESGLLGSSALVREPSAGLEPAALRAMINFDMVGRLGDGAVQVLGAASAEEWSEMLEPVCERASLECRLGGDGYGPSDQTPFYAAGVPVLHWFTGTHEDYHRPSDDSHAIDPEGIARIAAANVDLVVALADRDAGLTYVEATPPQEGGDVRSFGASLGTIPDYVGDDRPGVLLAGARPESAAARAGVQKGDLLVELGGQEIRNIYDFVFVLRSAKPGETTTLAVLRGEERLELEVTYGEGRSRP